MIPSVTKEQIEKAKEWDLLSYLQTYEPQELKRCGPHEYCTQTHDSLKISNGKWCWNSRGIGGRTALDYLIKVRGMDFVGAVEALCGYRPPPPQERPAPKPPKPFQLPEASRFPSALSTIDLTVTSFMTTQAVSVWWSKTLSECSALINLLFRKELMT